MTQITEQTLKLPSQEHRFYPLFFVNDNIFNSCYVPWYKNFNLYDLFILSIMLPCVIMYVPSFVIPGMSLYLFNKLITIFSKYEIFYNIKKCRENISELNNDMYFNKTMSVEEFHKKYNVNLNKATNYEFAPISKAFNYVAIIVTIIIWNIL